MFIKNTIKSTKFTFFTVNVIFIDNNCLKFF